MFLKYKVSSSARKFLPQGTYLEILLFIITFNGALLRPGIPRPSSLSLKYVDDLSVLQAVNLKDDLDNDPVTREYPLTYSERTSQILSPAKNYLQESLDELYDFTSRKLMKLKEKKTNIMKFNTARNSDFPPEIKIQGFTDNLVLVSETKLLGVVISEDLKWESNTQYICKKASKKLWILRRMKLLDIDSSIILDVYIKEIRSVLELAVPAWHSGLTRKQASMIERIQKIAVNIILSIHGNKNTLSYQKSLSVLGIESLERRRLKLCEKFARKSLKSRHKDMFKENASQYNTRHKFPFAEYSVHSSRAFKSPLIYLTRLLNNNPSHF